MGLTLIMATKSPLVRNNCNFIAVYLIYPLRLMYSDSSMCPKVDKCCYHFFASIIITHSPIYPFTANLTSCGFSSNNPFFITIIIFVVFIIIEDNFIDNEIECHHVRLASSSYLPSSSSIRFYYHILCR